MARRTLDRHPKFKRLWKELRISRALARGHLELWWDSAHDKSCPEFVNAAEVEACAEWEGEPGELVRKLVELKLIDKLPGGRLQVHDYWEHCPDYVIKRRQRRLATAADNGRQRQTLAAERRPDPDPEPKPEPMTRKSPIGSAAYASSEQGEGQEQSGRRAKRGGTPSAAGVIAHDLLKGIQLPQLEPAPAPKSKKPTYNCYSFTALEVSQFISSFERTSNHEKAHKAWHGRCRQIEALKGGLHFLQELCDHVQESVHGNDKKGIAKLNNIAAYCNAETLKFLEKRKAQ